MVLCAYTQYYIGEKSAYRATQASTNIQPDRVQMEQIWEGPFLVIAHLSRSLGGLPYSIRPEAAQPLLTNMYVCISILALIGSFTLINPRPRRMNARGLQ